MSVRKTATVLLAMFLAVFLGASAFASGEKEGESTLGVAARPKPLNEAVLGVDYLGLQHDFIVALKNAVADEAKKHGVRLVELDAKGDSANQLTDVEQLISRRVDVILFNGLDRKASTPALEMAAKANIPVITFNTWIDGPHLTWVGSHNVQSGEIVGQWLSERLAEKGSGNLKVLYIRGIPGHPAFLERDEGLKKGLGADASRIQFVERVANFDREQALRVTEEALSVAKDYDVVYAQNDSMILGALQALKAFGLAGVKTIGIDGIPEALEAVASGELTATVFQDAEGQGRGAVQAAVDYLQGKTPPKEVVIPFFLVDRQQAPELLERVKVLYGMR